VITGQTGEGEKVESLPQGRRLRGTTEDMQHPASSNLLKDLKRQDGPCLRPQYSDIVRPNTFPIRSNSVTNNR